jgi:K+-transporting ATPase A subunit
MLIGEIVYGGLGTGLYSMIFIALMALFVGGQVMMSPRFAKGCARAHTVTPA